MPTAAQEQIDAALNALRNACRPLVLIGNGAVRAGATGEVTALIDTLGAPFTTTFMAKGAVSDEHPLALATTGLSENEHTTCGFDQADLVVAVGYDLVEYDPGQWHKMPTSPFYIPQCSVVGDIADNLSRLTTALRAAQHQACAD